MRRLVPCLLLLAGCGQPAEPTSTAPGKSPSPITPPAAVPTAERSIAQAHLASVRSAVEVNQRLQRDWNLEQARILSRTSRLYTGPHEFVPKAPKRFETDCGADARIVACLGGAVLLDRGARHQLPLGTRFQAFRFERGGLRTVFGLLEVYELEEERAWAFVVRGGLGLVPGLELTSPTYDDEEQKVYVFFRPPSRQAAEATRRLGTRVDEKVSIETDFLVLPPGFVEGQDPDDDGSLRRARQFGIIELSADEAALYLGLTR